MLFIKWNNNPSYYRAFTIVELLKCFPLILESAETYTSRKFAILIDVPSPPLLSFFRVTADSSSKIKEDKT